MLPLATLCMLLSFFLDGGGPEIKSLCTRKPKLYPVLGFFPPVVLETTAVQYQDTKCLISPVLFRWRCGPRRAASPLSADDHLPSTYTTADSTDSDALHQTKTDPRSYLQGSPSCFVKTAPQAKTQQTLSMILSASFLQQVQRSDYYLARNCSVI